MLLLELSIFAGGLIIGSFLNVCIYRIPRQISLLNPRRSICPQCRAVISWWQNIPLISFALLKGRCYHCNQPVSYLYPAIELLSGLLALLFFWRFGLSGTFWFYLLLAFGLVVISVIDFQFKLIPNPVLAFLMISAILLNVWLKLIPWEKALWGAALSFMLLLLIRSGGQYILQKESMGMGDVKLAALLGFYLGWQHFLLALFIAACCALIVIAVIKIVFRKSYTEQIPFGPYLSLGALGVLYWAEAVRELFDGFLWGIH
ncbi:MAG: prepilin peptidase [Calditrichaeota bacterium]|nr:prepilin peptidase [Calditrichota bacterium]MCB0290411.1 prepilin peptidase [Calditrichota bacterium]MCB0294004.1 prepilin peptidase [Calditrichota bacterium]MCB0303406.1 prepilin peptidase [Calditrichota bacterium]MCB0315332.1 prepilin peptidase [Calditrichota bacterium]